MARVTGPLFSLGASGAIGKALVYADWKGLDYVRRYVIPYNPRSDAQVEIRDIFLCLNEVWKRMPLDCRQPWIFATRGKPLTDRNLFIKANLPVFIGETTLDRMVMSASSGQAIPPSNVVTADGADGTITVTADAPGLPTGYTLSGIQGFAIPDGDPEETWDRVMTLGSDASPPFSFTIPCLINGIHQVGVVALFERTVDTTPFYSAAIRSQVTVTGVA